MATPKITIIGAGMAGCLAGIYNSNAAILEASSDFSTASSHKSILRFRSCQIMDLTGIEMKKVKSRKFIWDSNAKNFCSPNPQMANLYSIKTTGGIYDRSIWDIGVQIRYIPPKNFHERLIDICKDRICWNTKINSISDLQPPIISTIPMNSMIRAIGVETELIDKLKFTSSPISIYKFNTEGESYQTIYYPSHSTPIYRSSIIGNELIIEAAEKMHGSKTVVNDTFLDEVFRSFGITKIPAFIGKYSQLLGKIAPVSNDRLRREFIFNSTVNFGLYALGRFATWRNIQLDDVIKDLTTIRKLIQSDNYQARRESLCES